MTSPFLDACSPELARLIRKAAWEVASFSVEETKTVAARMHVAVSQEAEARQLMALAQDVAESFAEAYYRLGVRRVAEFRDTVGDGP